MLFGGQFLDGQIHFAELFTERGPGRAGRGPGCPILWDA